MKDAMFLSIMQGKSVFCGQVPSTYQRFYMANSIDINFLKEVFDEILKFSHHSHNKNVSELGNVTAMLFSHLSSFINDYYMYYVLQ